MTWTLIIFMGIAGLGNGITSLSVPGFKTHSACEAARDAFVDSLEYKRYTVARCVEVS